MDLVFNYEYNLRIKKGFGERKDVLQRSVLLSFSPKDMKLRH